MQDKETHHNDLIDDEGDVDLVDDARVDEPARVEGLPVDVEKLVAESQIEETKVYDYEDKDDRLDRRVYQAYLYKIKQM